MKKYTRILFVEEHGNIRAPMAEAIFKESILASKIEAESRGLIVLFGEPMNQKAQAILKSNGIELEDFETKALIEEDFKEDTLIIVMEHTHRNQIQQKFGETCNVEVLTELTGEELEIMDPYGGTLAAYGLCFETLNTTMKKLITLLNEGE
ncbi:MAG: phosphotyrosine protein phosphatase [Lachnospiraceae bacterium]